MLDDFLWLLSGFALWVFVAPLAALMSSNAARQRVARIEQHLSWLQMQVSRLESAGSPPPRPPLSVFRAAPHYPDPTPAAAQQPVVDAQLSLHLTEPSPTTNGSQCEASVNPLPPRTEIAPAIEVAPTTDAPPPTVEEKLGLHGLTRIGAGVFLIGALLFLGHAVERDWIGPALRVCLGLGFGVSLLGVAHLVAAKSRPMFVVALRGLGLSILFAAIWMSSSVYGLVSPPVALLGQVAVLGLGAAMAVRYRAEGILIWSLVCGFATPWISNLSPGLWDTAAYLFLLTGAVYGVSARRGFTIAPWLALAGTCASAAWGGAQLGLVGDGSTLWGRADVLFAASAFAAQWLVFTRRFAHRTLGAEAAGLFGTVVAATTTLAAVVLLWDLPGAMVLALIGATAAARWALAASASRAWLWWPTLVGFFGLVGTVATDAADAGWLALTAGWAAVHAYGLGVRRVAEEGRSARLAMDPASAVPVAGWWILALATLGIDGRDGAAWWTAVVVIVIGAIARASSARWLSPLAVAASALALVGVASASPSAVAGEPGFLLALAGWFIAAAALAVEPYVRAVPPPLDKVLPNAMPAVGWAIATLGAELALFAATTDEHRLLRSAVLGVGAVIGAGCAALLYHARRAEAEVLIRTSLGLAVAQLSVAIAFLWSGAVVTVIWAALGATLVTLGADHRSRTWLGGGLVLVTASIVRMLLIDVAASQRMAELFLATGGERGVFPLPAIAHPQAYALAGVGAALLVSARALRKQSTLNRLGVMATVMGLGLWIALGITEVRAVLLDTSGVAMVSDVYAFRTQIESAIDAQAGILAVSATLVLAVFALGVLAVGFAGRDDLYRRLGLVLFALAGAKTGLYDIWNVDPAARIGLLLGVGALLVVGGFLYARFAAQLLAKGDLDRVSTPS